MNTGDPENHTVKKNDSQKPSSNTGQVEHESEDVSAEIKKERTLPKEAQSEIQATKEGIGQSPSNVSKGAVAGRVASVVDKQPQTKKAPDRRRSAHGASVPVGGGNKVKKKKSSAAPSSTSSVPTNTRRTPPPSSATAPVASRRDGSPSVSKDNVIAHLESPRKVQPRVHPRISPVPREEVDKIQAPMTASDSIQVIEVSSHDGSASMPTQRNAARDRYNASPKSIYDSSSPTQVRQQRSPASGLSPQLTKSSASPLTRGSGRPSSPQVTERVHSENPRKGRTSSSQRKGDQAVKHSTDTGNSASSNHRTGDSPTEVNIKTEANRPTAGKVTSVKPAIRGPKPVLIHSKKGSQALLPDKLKLS